jgi:hypothetical protein
MQDSEDGVVMLCTCEQDIAERFLCTWGHDPLIQSNIDDYKRMLRFQLMLHKSLFPLSQRSIGIGHHFCSYLCWLQLSMFVSQIVVVFRSWFCSFYPRLRPYGGNLFFSFQLVYILCSLYNIDQWKNVDFFTHHIRIKYPKFSVHDERQRGSDTRQLQFSNGKDFFYKMRLTGTYHFLILNFITFWSRKLIHCILYRACCTFSSFTLV